MIAHRFSDHRKSGFLDGEWFGGRLQDDPVRPDACRLEDELEAGRAGECVADLRGPSRRGTTARFPDEARGPATLLEAVTTEK